MGSHQTPIRSQPSTARRVALRLGYINGGLWSIGNGLTSGSLITYLVIDLGAEGVGVSLVLAIQALVGTLRVFAPALVGWFGSARRACLTLTLASYLLIFLLPIVTWLGSPLRALPPVATMITLLCVHQLLEHLGTVALWTWWANLVPTRIRGRYFGRRNGWQLAVLIPALWASGRFVDAWKDHYPESKLAGYTIVTAVGATFLLASLATLMMMPERIGTAKRSIRRDSQREIQWPAMAAPLGATAFRRFLLFGLWFSLVNGLTQSAQNIYPKTELNIGLAEQAALVMLMRVGQAVYSLWVGSFSDRYGNRPALILSQLLQAVGMLCFFFSSPEQPRWIYGAWMLWSAFAGINICQTNLLLKLAPRGQTAAYLGIYAGLTGLIYAAGTLAGGYLFDFLKVWAGNDPGGPLQTDFYHYLFLCGWTLRSMAVLWLLRVIEPGAWTWRQLLRRMESKHRALVKNPAE